MKTLFIIAACCLSTTIAISQNAATKTATKQNDIGIKVPDFTDPEVKKFYNIYSAHLLKCVQAIREKNESKAIALFKNPGEQLVSREKVVVQKLVKDPVEKQKYMQLAEQVYPYLKEVEQSAYYQKTYGKK